MRPGCFLIMARPQDRTHSSNRLDIHQAQQDNGNNIHKDLQVAI